MREMEEVELGMESGLAEDSVIAPTSPQFDGGSSLAAAANRCAIAA